MEKEIDCTNTSEVVCPYCGYESSDSYDYFYPGNTNDAEIECGECYKEFSVYRDIFVSYNSYKKK